jgi:DNA-binding MarR family transcriptional regulator
MKDTLHLWPLMNETMVAFSPFYQDEMIRAIVDHGVRNVWFPLSLARGAEPDPLSLERMARLNPYTAREHHRDALRTLIELEMLEPIDGVDGDRYRLTDSGRTAVEAIFAAAHRALDRVHFLPPEDTETLAVLLGRVVQASLDAPEPATKPALQHSRWTDPGPGKSAVSRIDQYLTDLSRFRDDVHIAAWRAQPIDAVTVEALTYLWRGESDSPADLADRLSFRGHSQEVYRTAFQGLVSKGWAKTLDGRYEITEQGARVREEIEEKTEELFFSPWATLLEEELNQVEALLKEVRAKLHQHALHSILNLCQETSQDLFQASREAVNPIAQRYGLDRRGDLFVLVSAAQLSPEGISAEHMRARLPYTHPRATEQILARLAEDGMLNPTGGGEYELSAPAKQVLDQLFSDFFAHLDHNIPLPLEEMEQLRGLLERLVNASLEAPEPDRKGHLTLSHHGHPDRGVGPVSRVDQLLDDLNAFREDAHLAAWQPTQVGPEAWEAFTLIWRGKAHTAGEIAKQLEHRGYTLDEYARALNELVERGWLSGEPDNYRLTPLGHEVRERAEAGTDELFFAPWACLTDLELARLRRLLLLIQDEIPVQAPVPG